MFLCTTGAATGPLITGWVADDFVRVPINIIVLQNNTHWQYNILSLE